MNSSKFELRITVNIPALGPDPWLGAPGDYRCFAVCEICLEPQPGFALLGLQLAYRCSPGVPDPSKYATAAFLNSSVVGARPSALVNAVARCLAHW